MAHYVIGDVQGCFNELEALISKFGFDPNKDKIIFAGDLVNRGENSLGVLDFCLKYKDSTHAVLGNHDFYLMHLIASNGDDEHLQEILNSPKLDKFYEWLKQLPLFKEIKINKTNESFYISHAGLPFFWSFEDAQLYSDEISFYLKNHTTELLENIWGDIPAKWSNELSGYDRLRTAINYFTRMRFMDIDGALDLNHKDASSKKDLYKWFDLTHKNLNDNEYIIFGHWASIEGKTGLENIIGLDTGCVWGKKLTAIRLEDKKLFSVDRYESL